MGTLISNVIMSEVLDVLNRFDEEDIKKIPKKLIECLKENSDKNYINNIDYTKPIKELKLHDETIYILDMICFNYWCENDLQKKEFLYQLNKNEQRYQEELREKYNPDNLFKNLNNSSEKIQDNISTETAMVEYKEKNFIQRLFDKIKNLFRKN